MGTTPLGIVYPDPSAPPRRQDLQDLAESADAALSTVLAGFAGTAYVPSLTNVTLGTGGSVVGAYREIEGWIKFRALITFGTGGALTGSAQIGLPVPALAALGTANFPVGNSSLRDASASATVYGGCRMLASAAGVAPTYNTSATSSSDCTASAPWTWTNGDTIWVAGEYQRA